MSKVYSVVMHWVNAQLLQDATTTHKTKMIPHQNTSSEEIADFNISCSISGICHAKSVTWLHFKMIHPFVLLAFEGTLNGVAFVLKLSSIVERVSFAIVAIPANSTNKSQVLNDKVNVIV